MPEGEEKRTQSEEIFFGTEVLLLRAFFHIWSIKMQYIKI